MRPAHFHDVAGDLFTIVEKFLECSKILAMLLSHSVMLLKFVLYSFSVRYFSYFVFIFRVGLIDSCCRILIKFGCINRDISSATSSKWAGSITS